MASAAIGALVTGDFAAAARATDGARRHAEASGERFVTSRVAFLDGVIADLEGDPHAAYRHVEQSLRLLDELGHESVTAQAQLLAVLADRCDQPELAEQWRRFADPRSDGWSHFDGNAFATAHNHAGLHARKAGDLDRAEASHVTALTWHRAAGLTVSAAFAASCLGFLASERGDVLTARRHHATALALAEERRDGMAMALALEGAASVIDGHEDAARLLGAAEQLRANGPRGPEPTHRERGLRRPLPRFARPSGTRVSSVPSRRDDAWTRRASSPWRRRSCRHPTTTASRRRTGCFDALPSPPARCRARCRPPGGSNRSRAAGCRPGCSGCCSCP